MSEWVQFQLPRDAKIERVKAPKMRLNRAALLGRSPCGNKRQS